MSKKINQTAQWYNPMQWNNPISDKLRERQTQKNIHMLNPNQRLITIYYKQIQRRITELQNLDAKVKADFNKSTYKNYNAYLDLEQNIKEAIEQLQNTLSSMQKIANSNKLIRLAQDFNLQDKQKQYFQEIQDTKNLQNIQKQFQTIKSKIQQTFSSIVLDANKTPEGISFINSIAPALEYFNINSTSVPKSDSIAPADTSTPTSTSTPSTPSVPSTPSTPTSAPSSAPAPSSTPSASSIASTDILNKAKDFGLDPDKALKLMQFFLGNKIVMAKTTQTTKKANKTLFSKAPKSWD